MTRHWSLAVLIALSVVCAASRAAVADATATTWQPNTFYKAGDQVSFNGFIYQVLQAHTSQVGWEPSKVSSLFIRPVPRSCRPWQVQTSYGVGSVATFGGKFFRALQAHDSVAATWTPEASPSLWGEIDPITCPIDARYCCESAVPGTGNIRIKAKGCKKLSDNNTGSCKGMGLPQTEVTCNGDQIFSDATGELSCF